jgi:5-methylcytosine-specific restriction endonuclease McrA
MRICSGPGCMASVPDGVRFCEECTPIPVEGDGMREHQPANRAAPSTSGGLKLSGNQRAYVDEIQREYQSKTWREGTRRWALRQFPFCEECKDELSAVIDHRIPVRLVIAACRKKKMFPLQKLPGFHIRENLRGMCHSCHNKKTATEEAKDWTDELDALLQKYRGRNWFKF